MFVSKQKPAVHWENVFVVVYNHRNKRSTYLIYKLSRHALTMACPNCLSVYIYKYVYAIVKQNFNNAIAWKYAAFCRVVIVCGSRRHKLKSAKHRAWCVCVVLFKYCVKVIHSIMEQPATLWRHIDIQCDHTNMAIIFLELIKSGKINKTNESFLVKL